MSKRTLQSIKYSRGSLQILDQTLLPSTFQYENVNDSSGGWEVIASMKVRGAPAIAITASLSLAVEIYSVLTATPDKKIKFRLNTQKPEEFETKTSSEILSSSSLASTFIENNFKYLTTSRPTAVNLGEASISFIKKAESLAKEHKEDQDGGKKVFEQYLIDSQAFFESDLNINKQLSSYAANFLVNRATRTSVTPPSTPGSMAPTRKLSVLTHCNTGSLATAGYGTALGVIRALNEKGLLECAYCTETRPYNQGSRLTALELVYENIPHRLICDSMVASLMSSHTIDAVIVGADRVTSNGDTANKIGTYTLAICAQYHNIPFYVACPSQSFDLSLTSGSEIHIEHRKREELTTINGVWIAPKDVKVWNPAFDVTPATLIEAIFTEYGVIERSPPPPLRPFADDGEEPHVLFNIPSFLTSSIEQ